jgi:hypothetical protein
MDDMGGRCFGHELLELLQERLHGGRRNAGST